MKRIVLSFFSLLMVSAGVFAQVEFTSGPIILEANLEDQIFEDILITNNTSETMEIYWEYEPGEDYPENWRTQLCDLNLCYLWDAFSSSPSLPNVIEPGQEVLFTIKVKHIVEGELVSGSSCGVLRLYNDADKTNEVAASLCTTSTDDVNLEDLVIYPNPTTETFQIKNDGLVASISLYNIVGRLVQSFNHSDGMIHDVASLRSGMYLVRLEDKNGDVLKSMRLSKR